MLAGGDVEQRIERSLRAILAESLGQTSLNGSAQEGEAVSTETQ